MRVDVAQRPASAAADPATESGRDCRREPSHAAEPPAKRSVRPVGQGPVEQVDRAAVERHRRHGQEPCRHDLRCAQCPQSGVGRRRGAAVVGARRPSPARAIAHHDRSAIATIGHASALPPQVHVFRPRLALRQQHPPQESGRSRPHRFELRAPCATDARAAALAARVGPRTARQARQYALPLRSHGRQRVDQASLRVPDRVTRRRGAAGRALGHRRRCCSIMPTSRPIGLPPTKRFARTRRRFGAASSGARWPRPATT